MSLGYNFQPVDVDLPEHPRVRRIEKRLRRAALGLYVAALCYARKHTPGVVPCSFVEDDDPRVVAELVRVGLWIEREDGDWDIHNWEKKSPGRKRTSEPPGASTPRVAALRERRAAAANEADVTAGVTVETAPVTGVFPSPSPSSSVSSGSDQGGAGGKRPLRPDEPLTDGLRASFEALTLSVPALNADEVWEGFVSNRYRAGMLYPSATAIDLDWREWVKRQVRFASKDRGRADTRQPLRNPESADWLKKTGGDL